MAIANRLCGIVVETALLFLFVLAALAPLHAATTRHMPLVQSIDSTHAVIGGDVEGLSVGDRMPLYRFHYNWKTPIGTVSVDRVDEGRAVIYANPKDMRYDLGYHGTLHVEKSGVYASLGSVQGFKSGDYLTIYRGGRVVGQALIVEAEESRSKVSVAADLGNPEGLIVSDFSVHTEVTLFDSPAVTIFETVVIFGALALYAAVYIRKRRSPFLVFGEWVRSLPIPRRPLWWAINIAAGVPFVWFMGKMPVRLATYIGDIIIQHTQHRYSFLAPAVDPYLPSLWAALAVLYYGYLLWKRESPVFAFWRLISYKKIGVIKKVSWRRGLALWALHLIIVYVFARTLIGFLYGDIAAVEIIGFPDSSEEFFAVSKYVIWALTVAGCLLGYGYSVVGILWGTFIRNLDFTLTGWLTNAFCYPLLGAVVWGMLPSFTGSAPIITDGPLVILMLVLGLVFNILYMLSIWNLGTMFDLMADKGVRTSFFYGVIRHPNYMLEACMFFVVELVGLTSGIEWMAFSMFFFLYWIRSEREDNFMTYSNPAYTPYRERTPYKCIPGIY